MKRLSSPFGRESAKQNTFIQVLLTPPKFTDPQTNVLAQTLYFLLIFTAVISGGYAVLTWFIADEPSGAFLSGSMALIAVFLLWLLKRRKIQHVSRVLIVSGYLAIMVTLFMNGGLRDEAGLVLIALLSIAGFMLGMQIVIPLGVVTAVMLIILYFAEIHGLIPEQEHFLPVAIDELMMGFIAVFVTTVILFQITRLMSQNTEQIEAQAKFLSERNHQLNETQEALIVAKEQAEEANRLRSIFFSRMSHDLRTPLSGILGIVTHLSDNGMQLSVAEQQELLRGIKRGGTHLLNLINDLLDIARLEAHQLQLHVSPTALLGTLSEVVMMLRLTAEDKGLELHLQVGEDVPEIVQVDEQRLQQILINLVGNGVKFTDKGEVVLLVTAVAQKDGLETAVSTLHFEVADTGCGIAPDQLETIFDPFVQGEQGPSQIPGTGLGLAICRQLVEAMGGTLQVESHLGQGSRFWFTLDLEVGDGEPG